jgi:general L-amino acid transport system permease protein
MIPARAAPPKKKRWSWRSKALRSLLFQAFAIGLLVAAGAWLLHNTLANMRLRGIQSGFDFMLQPAGFSIGESIIPFDSAESYAKAFLVGLSNTLRVALVGIVLATGLGTLIGIGRLSRNLLLRTLCGAYVEFFRNVPLLLQLFVWYFVLTETLPPIEEALRPLANVYFSKNGLQFPIPLGEGGWFTGWDVPEKTELNVVGGGSVTPEYLTVLCGLTIYTAAYIAEIVRAGIQAVPYGQHEASAALGLTRVMEVRLVLLPQALRVIIPPVTSQYLNLTKNSSLAVAVGYPDLVSISNTSLNQTGRAIECITIIMACYLTLSLLTSWCMNAHNTRALLRER